MASERDRDFPTGAVALSRISKIGGDSNGRGLNGNCVMRTMDLRAKPGPGGGKAVVGYADKCLRGLAIYIWWFEEYDIQPVKQA